MLLRGSGSGTTLDPPDPWDFPESEVRWEFLPLREVEFRRPGPWRCLYSGRDVDGRPSGGSSRRSKQNRKNEENQVGALRRRLRRGSPVSSLCRRRSAGALALVSVTSVAEDRAAVEGLGSATTSLNPGREARSARPIHEDTVARTSRHDSGRLPTAAEAAPVATSPERAEALVASPSRQSGHSFVDRCTVMGPGREHEITAPRALRSGTSPALLVCGGRGGIGGARPWQRCPGVSPPFGGVGTDSSARRRLLEGSWIW